MVIIDDILIYSRSHVEHAKHLRVLLQILQEKKVIAKLKKCEFWLHKIAIFGHVISTTGVTVDSKKIDAIRDLYTEFPWTCKFLISVCERLCKAFHAPCSIDS